MFLIRITIFLTVSIILILISNKAPEGLLHEENKPINKILEVFLIIIIITGSSITAYFAVEVGITPGFILGSLIATISSGVRLCLKNQTKEFLWETDTRPTRTDF